MTDLLELAARVDGLKESSNEVDVLVEIALFEPDDDAAAISANAAGTKVIYYGHDGKSETHRAQDWTHGKPMRMTTARRLRARAHGGGE
ncbi:MULTISPECIES: hypothetical protein [Sphingomonas]|jgi:hypothetical protein|uniref:hypothetical protein n=1 Tax=Sphingomonas TaxID=13687 RepID=UPI0025504F89|nr:MULTISPECIES: hypothetical protein [Sphingomonas]MDK8188428.1 hypothetical protein [Sphingomonas zeae]MDK8216345.1 hypothetical protein [Sphingomonas sp. UMB7805-LC452B]